MQPNRILNHSGRSFIMRRWRSLLALCLLSLAFCDAKAHCTDRDMMDPVGDVVWDCIFPVVIAVIPVDYGDHPPDSTSSEFWCQCTGQGIYGLGFLVQFWEPARMVDTTNDPWCFPALGQEMDQGSTGSGYTGSGQLRYAQQNIAFQHFHYYVTLMWAILDLFTDIPCLSDETGFDLAMVSEVRADWNNEFTAANYYPETSLMANAYTVLACMADSVGAATGHPIDALYWCIGAWGTTYPMAGHIVAKDYVAANAGIAAKAMYVQARTGMLGDRAVNYCGTSYMPMWVKTHWRMQPTDPVVANRCNVLGYPGVLWTQHKNPVGAQDNFSWLLFRKVRCCVVIY